MENDSLSSVPDNMVLKTKLQLLHKNSHSRMNLIEDKLWIGDRTAAMDCDYLKKHNIYSTLTIDIEPLPVNQNCDQLFFRAHDVSMQDLMIFFAQTYEFVEKGKEKGSVLIHCFQGISRSATLAASYLMKKHMISLDEALDRLQKVRPAVQPNEGFMAQLRLYEQLLNHERIVGNSSIVTSWYNLKRAAKSISKYHYYQDSSQLDDELASVLKPYPNSQPALKCKQCRYVLASENQIIPHQPQKNPNWKDPAWVDFAFSAAVTSKQQSALCCRQSFFVVPPSWMVKQSIIDGDTNDEGSVGKQSVKLDGKIHCPKCSSKLGAFHWNVSLQCPCGAIFQPAFCFTASRVDLIQNN